MFFSPERHTKEKTPMFSPDEVSAAVKEFISHIVPQERQSDNPLKLSDDQRSLVRFLLEEKNVHTTIIRKLIQRTRMAQKYVFKIGAQPSEVALSTGTSAEVRAILGKDNNLKDVYISGLVDKQRTRPMHMPIHLLMLEEKVKDEENLYRLLQIPKRKRPLNELEGLNFSVDVGGNIVRDLVIRKGDNLHGVEAVYVYLGPLVIKDSHTGEPKKEYQVYGFNAALEREFVAAKGTLRQLG